MSPGRKLLGAHVSADVAEAFQAHARATAGGTAAALRVLIQEALGDPVEAPRGAGRGVQVSVRFRAGEREAVARAARERGMTPANWVRSLALARLSHQPQWSEAELAALRACFVELRRIGGNVNQIARALNSAVLSGDYPPHQGAAVKHAVEIIQDELRVVGKAIVANRTYWEPADARQARAEQTSRRRVRRRPKRFQD